MPVPTDLETGIEEAIEAGGVPAVLESPQEPVPSPVPSLPSAPEPQSEVPPAPDTGTPSETAPGPAPESEPIDPVVEDANPGSAGGSDQPQCRHPDPESRRQRRRDPGDDRAWVVWAGRRRGAGPTARVDVELDVELDHARGWRSPGMDIGEELVGEVLGAQPLGDPGQFFADPVEQPAEMESQPVGLAPGADHPPPARSHATAPGRVGAKQWSSGGSQLNSSRLSWARTVPHRSSRPLLAQPRAGGTRPRVTLRRRSRHRPRCRRPPRHRSAAGRARRLRPRFSPCSACSRRACSSSHALRTRKLSSQLSSSRLNGRASAGGVTTSPRRGLVPGIR